MIKVNIIPAFSDNYIYLIEFNKNAIVIDPCESESVIKILNKKKLNLLAILNTHHHFDHVGGNSKLKDNTGCEVIGGDLKQIPSIDRVVNDKEDIIFNDLKIEVLSVPGHTKNDISYFIPKSKINNENIVFTGDTLFIGGCGRLFECGPDIMFKSLNKLKALPQDTLVYCGHEYAIKNYEFACFIEPNNKIVQEKFKKYKDIRIKEKPTPPSTIASEIKTNPFLRAHDQELKNSLNMSNKSELEVFTEVRSKRNSF